MGFLRWIQICVVMFVPQLERGFIQTLGWRALLSHVPRNFLVCLALAHDKLDLAYQFPTWCFIFFLMLSVCVVLLKLEWYTVAHLFFV